MQEDRPLEIGIVGAGAIGGTLAVRLSKTGARIALVARGAHGKAIRDRGLVLLAEEGALTASPCCFPVAQDVPPQDVVIVAVKEHQLPALAATLPSMLKPGGRLVFAMNGIPWWFTGGGGRALPESLRATLDPAGGLARMIDAESVVGAVVQISSERVAPGVVREATGSRRAMVLGRIDGGDDAMQQRLAALLASAGCATRIADDIQVDIWRKTVLWASVGPVAALAGTHLGALTADAGTFALLKALMQEGIAIGRAFGLAVEEDVDTRLDFFRDKAVRPSMLQDLEAGRAPEIESGIAALASIASACGVEAPRVQMLAALLRARAAQPGVVPATSRTPRS